MLNETLVQEQYMRYLKNREQKQATEKTEQEQLTQEKIDREKYVANKRRIVTVRKNHACSICGKTIGKGEKAHVVSKIMMVQWKKGFYGDTLGFKTEYHCSQCSMLEAHV
jgi:DNA-directed RNA polymerase subunit RPC12/RpoP